jgi:VWFA-related protein
MKRSAGCIAFIFIPIFAVTAFAQYGAVKPTPTPDVGTVRVATEEIKINALAFDESGKFAPDLRPQDVVITDNDILHTPTSVRRMPASVLIVMDTGGEMRLAKTLEQTQKVAAAVVNSLREGDAVAVVQYSDKAEVLTEWSTDRNAVLAAIAKARFGRHSAFADAIELAKKMLVREDVENRHLVLITDGTDTVAEPGEKNAALRSLLSTDINVHVISYATLEAQAVSPQTSRVSKDPPPKAVPDVVAIGIQNSQGRPQDPIDTKVGPTINVDQKMLKTVRSRKADLQMSEAILTKIAEDTNGEIMIPETMDEMLEKAKLVTSLIDASYVVTYTPKFPLDEAEPGTVRAITVTSKNPDIVIQALRKLVIPNPKN